VVACSSAFYRAERGAQAAGNEAEGPSMAGSGAVLILLVSLRRGGDGAPMPVTGEEVAVALGLV
jgi:hypothetical protein